MTRKRYGYNLKLRPSGFPDKQVTQGYMVEQAEFDPVRLRALVARQLCERHKWGCSLDDAGDGRSLSAAPYAIYGSPMGRYRPMSRLLSDADSKYLGLGLIAEYKFRSERRKVFLGYVASLRKDAAELLSLQAQSAIADRAQTQRDHDVIQSAIASLVLAAWMHRLYLPGLPDRVTRALRDINGALGLGQLVQMQTS